MSSSFDYQLKSFIVYHLINLTFLVQVHKYTSAKFPERLLKVNCKNKYRAPFHALQQIVALTRTGELCAEDFDGFSSRQLIEITDKDLMAKNENELVKAVKTLVKLSEAIKKRQEKEDDVLDSYHYISLLFSNKRLSLNDFENIKSSLETVKIFAQANMRYKEALADAEEARLIIDQALEGSNLREDENNHER